MNITEVRVKLMHSRSDRLRAFCSITIDDDFVVHDLRVIEGRKGLFVAMPSRKLTDNCPKCGGKNELRAKHCCECGAKLPEGRADRAAAGRDKVHVDVAHPINTPCRQILQDTVLAAYKEEDQRVRDGLPPTLDDAAEAAGDFDEPYEDYGVPDLPDEAEHSAGELPAGGAEHEDIPDELPPFAGDSAQEREDAEGLGEPEPVPEPEPEAPVAPPAAEPGPHVSDADGRPAGRRVRRERPKGGFGDGIL